MRIDKDDIWIGRFFLKPHKRTVHTRFALKPTQSAANNAAYRETAKLILEIDRSRRVKIAELCDPVEADRIIENLTTALDISDLRNEYDIDPNRDS